MGLGRQLLSKCIVALASGCSRRGGGESVSTLTATVGGTSYSVLADGTFQVQQQLDTRWQYDFTLVDTANTATFSFGEAVTVTDSVVGNLFTGNILSAQLLDIVPQPYSRWKISAAGGEYRADKRTINKSYDGLNAGAMVVDMAQNVLVNEGIVTNAAQRLETTVADFGTGTLASTVAANTVAGGDGDLELQAAGTEVTFSQGPITFPSTSAIKLTGTQASVGLADAYCWVVIDYPAYTVVSGDTITYDIWITSESPQKYGGVMIETSDPAVPYPVPTPNVLAPFVINQWANFSALTNQWYTYSLILTEAIGKTINYIFLILDGDTAGDYTIYFRNISITNGATTKVSVFPSNATSFQTPPQIIQNAGYTNVSCSIVAAHDHTASIVSAPISLSSASIARSSYLSWDASSNPALITAISASVDGGATYLPCTLNSSLPGLLPGMSLSSANLLLKYGFTNTGSDPTLDPTISKLVGTVRPSYRATKSDVTSTTDTQAGWNGGTLTHLAAPSSNILQLDGGAKNWDYPSFTTFTDQTDFSNDLANSESYVGASALGMTTSGGHYITSRLDFAGTRQDFTLEVDLYVLNSTDNYGCVYRTTGWQNNDGSGAYYVTVTTAAIQLSKGTNSGSGAGSFTTISTVSFSSSLSVNAWYHLKIVVSGNSHQIYLDNVQYINATDSSYTAAGYIGLRYSDGGIGGTGVAYFDNFGVVASLAGTWVSPAIDIHSLGTISGSELIVQADPTNASFSTILAEISLDNGSTWHTCNDARQTSLTSALSSGTAYTALGVTALAAAIPNATSLVINYGSGTTQTVTLSAAAKVGETLLSVSSFTASSNFGGGTLVVPSSPASTSNALTVPGLTNGTNVSSITQAKIRLTISTTSASTGAAMPAIEGVTLLVMGAYSSSGTRVTTPYGIDTFSRANQSGFGTAFDGQAWTKTGTGTTAIASNEGTITNTTGDVYEVLGSTTGTDMDETVKFQLSAATIQAGMVLRYVDANNYYRLSVSTTAVTIHKNVAGTVIALATTALTVPTATAYYMRFRVVGSGPVNLYGKVWASGVLEKGVVNGSMSSTTPQWDVTAID